MNSRKVVACDADVLIHLAKLKILSSVTQIFKILIPRDIENELIRTTRPHKNQIQIQDEIEKKNIEIIEVGTDQINTIVQQYNMHYGEASVIALAQRKNIKIIFINEKKVRISAKSCNLIPIGTIGVLAVLHDRGILTTSKLIKLLLFIKENPKDFWINPEIIDEVIERIQKFSDQ